MGDIREKLASWMQGRYGIDELGRVLFGACIVLCVIELFFGTGVLTILTWLLLIVAVWRSLSLDISRRRLENERFCAATEKPRRMANQALNRWRNRKTTLYFRCKGCKTWLSVPRGKGTLRVVCPNCRKETIKKS